MVDKRRGAERCSGRDERWAACDAFTFDTGPAATCATRKVFVTVPSLLHTLSLPRHQPNANARIKVFRSNGAPK